MNIHHFNMSLALVLNLFYFDKVKKKMNKMLQGFA